MLAEQQTESRLRQSRAAVQTSGKKARPPRTRRIVPESSRPDFSFLPGGDALGLA